MPNSISKVVVLSSSCAERIGDTDKMKIVINAAVVDIEDNFLPLEAMDIYVNNKLVDTNTSDASGELTMTLQLDYNADTEVIVYAEHKVSGQKSPKKLLPLKGQSQNIIQVTAEENISETITLISKGEAIAKIRHDGLLLGKPEFSHLIDDTSVVTEAVKQNGLALEFASERLKKDITIFNVAVEQNEDAALFAEEELYKRYRQALVKSKHGWLDMEFSDNRIIFLPYIKEHKMKDFHNLSSRFRDDKEIMLYVVMHD